MDACQHVQLFHATSPGWFWGILAEAKLQPFRLHHADSGLFSALGYRKSYDSPHDRWETASVEFMLASEQEYCSHSRDVSRMRWCKQLLRKVKLQASNMPDTEHWHHWPAKLRMFSTEKSQRLCVELQRRSTCGRIAMSYTRISNPRAQKWLYDALRCSTYHCWFWNVLLRPSLVVIVLLACSAFSCCSICS